MFIIKEYVTNKGEPQGKWIAVFSHSIFKECKAFACGASYGGFNRDFVVYEDNEYFCTITCDGLGNIVETSLG